MSDTLTIAHGRVVQFDYVLTNDAGEVIDQSEGRGPMTYLHGFGNIVPGLEKELEGLTSGDAKAVRVAPGEGYGEKVEGVDQRVPRDQLPPDMDVQAGMPLRAQGPQGQPMVVWIAAVDADAIVVTPNHPLAGEHLNFDVTVRAIRESSDEEKAHGHVHGPGGHQH